MSEPHSAEFRPHWLDRFLPATALNARELGKVLKLRLTVRVALAMVVTGSTFAVLNAVLGSWWTGVLPCAVSVVIAAFVPFRIRAGAPPERSTWLMLAGLLIVLTSVSMGIGGVQAPTVAWFAIFPYLGHALVGRRAGLTLGLLAMGCVGFLLVGTWVNLFPDGRHLEEPLFMFAVTPFFMGLTLAVVSWFRSNIQHAVERDLWQAHIGLTEAVGDHERTQTQLEATHREFANVAQIAGSAEVAIGILHNLGNALNAVSVSTGLADAEAGGIRIAPFEQVAGLLQSQERVKEARYLRALAKDLGARQQRIRDELGSLREAVDHATAIVATQQRHAKRTSVDERVSVERLLRDAATLSRTSSSTTAQITVAAQVPDVLVDRHRLVQIVTNLLSNAQDALQDTVDATVSVTATLVETQLEIRVTDNGIGIDASSIDKVFVHGFTTKPTGHGFGLHASSLAATELGGELRVQSEGLGLGTTFILWIPVHVIAAVAAPQQTVNEHVQPVARIGVAR
jgi:signal transduction histidine kinase